MEIYAAPLGVQICASQTLRSVCRSESRIPGNIPAVTELSNVVVGGGADAVFKGAAVKFGPPPRVEKRRDALRRLGHAAERGDVEPDEALADALSSLTDDHPLVRLAAIHAVARVAPLGGQIAWRHIAKLLHDADEIVRVGAARAVGRIAEPGDHTNTRWRVVLPMCYLPRSRTVFIPKFSDVDNNGRIVRSPEAPRPLTLCNYDCKIFNTEIKSRPSLVHHEVYTSFSEMYFIQTNDALNFSRSRLLPLPMLRVPRKHQESY